ncbi:Putative flippase GtrA (transmembrane translocase of bactoprenol-linked glucose) [Candidatus Kryptobacter tengchongensis]|uniref:GtrA family protein n=1 Tax=Kryptobacter tengchongensis TaxID=1643429 RepID=UPI0007074B7E|nr:GtrA family protein [Candidatus Kryptobacter tengchongensis]CUS88396.1 Putative flippase GtrA (transmembrane translocase of bactoprenol-linked glucose) [Candidatus Kryptobacter tengchongensis]CUU04990.1 Putative flippase GtrA (transmembrane translocase of bactoprenol-linked glucose) [Candidatus Kryptobacter tengchongensis]CUU09976.1 Putative flippase GtrA (transmembrane translocase of bactoprenol-linked glucose) [Candidatus Kryptobacter tengchongensis]
MELIFKFIKFSIVGFTGVIVDFSVTFISKEKLKIQKYIANSLGFTLAATNNYILNRIWTFQSKDPAVLVQYGKFFLISLIGLLLNNLIVYLFHGRIKLNFYISKGFATIAVTLWNFFANYKFTFRF